MTQPKQKIENATMHAKEHKQQENTTNIFFPFEKEKKKKTTAKQSESTNFSMKRKETSKRHGVIALTFVKMGELLFSKIPIPYEKTSVSDRRCPNPTYAFLLHYPVISFLPFALFYCPHSMGMTVTAGCGMATKRPNNSFCGCGGGF